MTIASTTSKVSYNGSGSTGPFPITYKFTKNADITATKRASAGTETVLTLTTDYTLTGAGDASGGALTLTAALAVGESLVIARTPGIVQEVDYVENSAFPAETHESALDLLTTICQSLQEQVDRSVKVGISSTTSPDALLDELAADVASAAASAATATTQAGLANTARIAAELAETNIEATALTIETKLREAVSLEDFWRTGDGTDYSSALQRAMDSGEPVITGLGRTYTVGGGVTGRSGLVLRDIAFNAPSLATDTYVMDFSGTEGTPQTLPSSIAQGAFTVPVVDGTAFTAGGFAWLASNEYWAAAASDNVKYGELVQIASIVGNTLYLMGSTLLKYETGASATATPVSMVSNVVFDNVVATGPLSTGNQGGFHFHRCADVEMRNVRTTEFDYVHLLFEKSARCTVRGGMGRKTGAQEGLDYGVVFSSGCYDGLVDGYRADSMRHLVSIGGSQGISRHISAINCRGTYLTDAGLDAHSAVYEHTFSGNFLHFTDDTDTTIDGICTQGGAPIIFGNHIFNPKRHGVTWQPETLVAFTGPISGTFSLNRMTRPRADGSTSALNVITPATGTGVAPVTSLIIDGVQQSGFNNAVLLQAGVSEIINATIDRVQNDSPALSRSIYVNAVGADIKGLDIRGGHHEVATAATNPVIDIVGNGTGYVRHVRINGVHLKRGSGGTVGIRTIYVDDFVETNTTLDNITTKYSVDANSTGIRLDRRDSNIITVTNATYTVLPQDEAIICNRGSQITLTLPDAAKWKGRALYIKTIQAQTVISASSNVCPTTDSTAGTAILPATDGAAVTLRSDGTNWIAF